MNTKRVLLAQVGLICLLAISMSACGKKPVAAPPVAAPAPPPTDTTRAVAPELTARVEPEIIRKGDSANLIWETQNAELVVIGQGIGEVDKSGRIKIFPNHTSSYRILASGTGGVTEQTVTVEVTEDEPRSTEETKELAGKTLQERFAYFVKPVFFDYDSSDLKEAAKLTLDGNIRWLLEPENLAVSVFLEGHADGRGTAEYNLALGDKRAQIVKAYLVAHGVDSDRVTAYSLGEENPFDPRATEEAYAFNRRVHFLLKNDEQE